MEDKIKLSMPENAHYIIETLNENGFEAYIVGGCVRDSLLKFPPKDYDITTSALPNAVIKIFESKGQKVIKTGLKHGTVTVSLHSENYEITTFRIDGEYSDGRHPDKVEFTSSLKNDLSRRDFTINAIAYSDKDGIIDYFGGISDLKNKTIRCVGNANDRFSEDALRMMRAVRFKAQLGFEIDNDIKNALSNLSKNLKKISIERIRAEFDKILIYNPLDILLLESFGLLKCFLPEFEICLKTEQKNPHHMYNVGEHILKSTVAIESILHLRLAMFLHDIGKPSCKTTDSEGIDHFYRHPEASAEIAEKILKRMKYDNKTTESVLCLVKTHDYQINGKKQIRKLLNSIGEDALRDLLKVKEADAAAQSTKFYAEKHAKLSDIEYMLCEVLESRDCFCIKDLALGGKDIMDLGVNKGRKIGFILNKLLEAVLENPELNTKEYLLEYCKKFI